MTKVRNVATLLTLCGVAALPACSMFGGNQASRSSYPSYASASQSPQLSQDMIQQVQGRLQQQGVYHGNVDGVWGPGTKSAVRSYQQQHNLNATGKLDVDTLASLNLGDRTRAISATAAITIRHPMLIRRSTTRRSIQASRTPTIHADPYATRPVVSLETQRRSDLNRPPLSLLAMLSRRVDRLLHHRQRRIHV